MCFKKVLLSRIPNMLLSLLRTRLLLLTIIALTMVFMLILFLSKYNPRFLVHSVNFRLLPPKFNFNLSAKSTLRFSEQNRTTSVLSELSFKLCLFEYCRTDARSHFKSAATEFGSTRSTKFGCHQHKLVRVISERYQKYRKQENPELIPVELQKQFFQ